MKTNKDTNPFGLKESDLAYIVKSLSQFDTIDKAIIFGSRAKGNYSNGSDVDIAIKGTIDIKTVAKLSFLLNQESLMPYKFDIINYTKTKHHDLKKHIDRVGILIYDKNRLLIGGE